MNEEKIKKDNKLPLSEITLRKYEKPKEDISKRELVKKLCLSIGLLQPSDSRDIIVDILYSIIYSKKPLATKEIMEKVIKQRKKYNLAIIGLTYPNVCRQLRRLKQIMVIESNADKYRLNENDSFKNIFNEKIIKYQITSIQERINEYIDLI